MVDSPSEWLENEDRTCRRERISRLEWLVEKYPGSSRGFAVHGGWQALRLLEEARYCFTYGQFLATAVLGMAFIEQVLAARFYGHGRSDLERAQGESLLQEARENGWITETEHRQLKRIRQHRNRVMHYRRPLSPESIEGRSIEAERKPEGTLEDDARDVIAVVYAILAKSTI